MKRFLVILCPALLLAACANMYSAQKIYFNIARQNEVDSEMKSAALQALVDNCMVLQGDEQDHCYQQQAMENSSPDICEKIVGDRFRFEGINPQKDKCYSMVAAKVCDPGICDNIEGDGEFFSTIKCKQRISRLCP